MSDHGPSLIRADNPLKCAAASGAATMAKNGTSRTCVSASAANATHNRMCVARSRANPAASATTVISVNAANATDGSLSCSSGNPAWNTK